MKISDKCHIIAVSGGKGGVGKSLLSANLALATQKEFKSPTLLIDLDNKSCGDQNVILGIRSRMNVEQFSLYKQALSAQNLKKILGQHNSGLSFLSAVLSLDQKLNCDLEMFKKQLFHLSQFFSYIFVDIGCEMTDLQQEILNHSSAVLMVVAPEILTVNQSKRILNELSYLPSSLFYLVLNKENRMGLNPQLISKNLNKPFLASLPEDTAFAGSLHSSTPFILQNPNSVWTKNCYNIIRKLINQGYLKQGKGLGKKKPPLPSRSSAIQKAESEQEAPESSNLDPLTLFKLQIHSELIKEMDLKKDLTQAKDESSKRELKTKTKAAISKLVDLRGQSFSREERTQVIQHILDEALG